MCRRTHHSFALAHLTCFSDLPRGWLSLYQLQLAHGRKLPQQDRSPFSTFTLPDRLRFKRTAILPLPSLEAVNCQASEKIFWGSLDIIPTSLFPPSSPFVSFVRLDTRTSTTTHEFLALISLKPFWTSLPIAIEGESTATPSPR